ncbi:MAG: diadenylate cyclase CdaA [Oscillospiraceae bacterium]|nr:diadenylate cyclase CdaA [Oscillospiraceae bacterium]
MIMELLYEFKSSLLTILPPTFWDIVDIALLSYLIYKLAQFMRETRAGGLFKGVIVLLFCYFIAKSVEMKALSFILDNAFDVGLLAIIILFQPELRRTLEKVGHSKISKLPVFNQFSGNDAGEVSARWSSAIDAICDACEDLSATTTGALIVIERETKLGEQISNGTILNATPSKEIFGNIFYPKTPLHDGAVIMRDGVILAAACFLPKPANEELINKALGTRHRAAIGMSENSDAIIIVVSEETGAISLAENGELTRGYSRDTLKKTLRGKLLPEKTPKEKPSKDNAPKEAASGQGLFSSLFKSKNDH